MYYFFLDRLLLPIPPSAVTMRIAGSNKTVRLIDDSEINIIKNPGLTEVTFEFMIPSRDYPFATYGSRSLSASDIFSYLELLKTQKLPFQFIVSRMAGNKLTFNTNLKVTLEDYDIKESADYGFDQMVSVQLKQYRDYCTKTLKVDKNGKATVEKSRR